MTKEQFQYFISLFRSRSDVYARFWQKNAASGYSPAYLFDWQAFNDHRAQGGTLQTFTKKKTKPLTVGAFLQHVKGDAAIGVYPILPDNTCCFLAADFDGNNWMQDCQRYIEACHEAGLEAHLERSKSGKGGHVWIFFDQPYPCHKARQIGMQLIQKSTPAGAFRGQASFDRLFPNQDYVPRGGYGNLIALPLQGKHLKKGNTVFLNPITERPHDDQWAYVASIHKHTHEELGAALGDLNSTSRTVSPLISPKNKTLTITVNSVVTLRRQEVTLLTIAFLREELSFLNAEYLTKRRLGKPTYDADKYFQLLEESGEQIILPRGFLTKLTSFLEAQHIAYKIVRHHAVTPAQTFKSSITLRPEQTEVVEASAQHHEGVIVAPPGSGKTMMALELIARQQKPALVLVHRKQLVEQWVEQIQTHLGIPKKHIGLYTSQAKRLGEQITVGSLQTLARAPLSTLREQCLEFDD